MLAHGFWHARHAAAFVRRAGCLDQAWQVQLPSLQTWTCASYLILQPVERAQRSMSASPLCLWAWLTMYLLPWTLSLAHMASWTY